MTQQVDLLNYIDKHGSITRMEAFTKLGICELSSRIGELEAKGHVFPRGKKSGKATNGRKWIVTQYYKENRQCALL